MSMPVEVTRVGVVSAVPLFQMGVQAAFAGRDDFDLGDVAETVTELRAIVARAQPDVVLIDADLADADPVEAGSALRLAHPSIGVVLLGRASDDLLFRALDGGLSAFVPTSARTPTLLAATRHAAVAPSSFSAPDLAAAMARRDRRRSLLSPREAQVLRLLRDGLTTQRIAETIGVSESTAKTYVARVYDKLGVRTRAEAIAARVPEGGQPGG